MAVDGRITYFEEAGPKNTQSVLELSATYVDQSCIDTILVASTEGSTALAALEAYVAAVKNREYPAPEHCFS